MGLLGSFFDSELKSSYVLSVGDFNSSVLLTDLHPAYTFTHFTRDTQTIALPDLDTKAEAGKWIFYSLCNNEQSILLTTLSKKCINDDKHAHTQPLNHYVIINNIHFFPMSFALSLPFLASRLEASVSCCDDHIWAPSL